MVKLEETEINYPQTAEERALRHMWRVLRFACPLAWGIPQPPFPTAPLNLSRAPHSSFPSLLGFSFAHFGLAHTVQYYNTEPGLSRMLLLQTSLRLTLILLFIIRQVLFLAPSS